MVKKHPPESLSESEIAERMDRALRRSLVTPPKPHKDRPKLRPNRTRVPAAKPGTEPE